MADVEKKTEFVEETKGEHRGTDGAITLPKETLEYFDGDEIRARVFYEKYALKDLNDNILENTPLEMWDRIAREMANVEATDEKRKEWNEKFKWLLYDFKFIPGGRIMFGAGQPRKATLLNCYVVGIRDDSLESIFDWCKEAARTYSFGGGVGTDISILRPRGSHVNNSAVYSTGSISFMNLFSETTRTIGQKARRGALMITLSVDHPDIFDFIRIKRDMRNVRYANISVRITDEFMRAVESDSDFMLRYENDVIGRFERKVKARALWNELVQSARDWAEPGLLFWDAVKRDSPSEYNGMEVITTNPCSEQPLQNYAACDLGNINLSAFVLDAFTDDARLDWDGFEKVTRYSVRFLDNVLDYNNDKHPLKAQSDATRNSRRIGVGVTGLGDMLVKLRIRYDSDQAIAFIDSLFDRMKTTAYDESVEIAKEKGSFPLFDKEKHVKMGFVKRLNPQLREKIYKSGIRNVAVLTIPPVGSGSVLAGTSSGIEPIFAFSYNRRSESLSQEHFKVYHPLVLQYMAHHAEIKEEGDLPEFFVPAHKIKPEFRVRMQGTIQKHIDSAISSTVNLPRDTTTENVGNIYLLAWKAGCKGITVYREGSREGILITDEQKEIQDKEKAAKAGTGAVAVQQRPQEWARPQAMIGKTVKLKVPQGSLYLTANFDNEQIREVFVQLGKTGSEEKSYCEAIGRIASKYLQIGGTVTGLVDSLKGIKSNQSIVWDRGVKLYSVPDAIAKAIEIATGITPMGSMAPLAAPKGKTETHVDGYQTTVKPAGRGGDAPMAAACPKCTEQTLVMENGCFICKSCGYTKCE